MSFTAWLATLFHDRRSLPQFRTVNQLPYEPTALIIASPAHTQYHGVPKWPGPPTFPNPHSVHWPAMDFIHTIELHSLHDHVLDIGRWRKVNDLGGHLFLTEISGLRFDYEILSQENTVVVACGWLLCKNKWIGVTHRDWFAFKTCVVAEPHAFVLPSCYQRLLSLPLWMSSTITAAFGWQAQISTDEVAADSALACRSLYGLKYPGCFPSKQLTVLQPDAQH